MCPAKDATLDYSERRGKILKDNGLALPWFRWHIIMLLYLHFKNQYILYLLIGADMISCKTSCIHPACVFPLHSRHDVGAFSLPVCWLAVKGKQQTWFRRDLGRLAVGLAGVGGTNSTLAWCAQVQQVEKGDKFRIWLSQAVWDTFQKRAFTAITNWPRKWTGLVFQARNQDLCLLPSHPQWDWVPEISLLLLSPHTPELVHSRYSGQPGVWKRGSKKRRKGYWILIDPKSHTFLPSYAQVSQNSNNGKNV